MLNMGMNYTCFSTTEAKKFYLRCKMKKWLIKLKSYLKEV